MSQTAMLRLPDLERPARAPGYSERLAAKRLRAAADQLEDLDRGPSAQGLALPRERRRDAPVTVDADQLRLVADLLEHPAFGA